MTTVRCLVACAWSLNISAYVTKAPESDRFVDALQTIGKFWAILDEVPQILAKTASANL